MHADRATDQILAQDEAVVFDQPGISYGKCFHPNNSPNFYIWQAGYYHVFFNLCHQEACQFSVFMNGALVVGTTVGSPTGASQNTLTAVIFVSPADISVTPTGFSPTGFAADLQVTNHRSYVPFVTLNGLAGSGSVTPQMVAACSIFLLAPVWISFWTLFNSFHSRFSQKWSIMIESSLHFLKKVRKNTFQRSMKKCAKISFQRSMKKCAKILFSAAWKSAQTSLFNAAWKCAQNHFF